VSLEGAHRLTPPSSTPSLPERDLGSLSLGQVHSRIPLNGVIETTFRCNLRCVHCYVNEAAGDAAEIARELDTERVLKLVDEIADQGCLFLLLTGGEVLIRPDFEQIYLRAIHRGLLVTVFTNGTMITERIADLLAEHPPLMVEVSIYGNTRETYERVTQIPGSFDKCRSGIELLIARAVPTKLKTMALTINQHEIVDMEAFAKELGTTFRFDGFLNPRVDCGANRNGELQLSAEQIVALDLADEARMQEYKEFCERSCQPQEGAANEYVYSCGAGENSFTVDPYGNLQMCQLSRRHSFSLKDGAPFTEGWNEYFPKLRARKWQHNDACRKCNLMSLCGNCPGAAEMETGDVEGMIAHFCEITHLRASAVMGERSGHLRDATCCLGNGKLAQAPEGSVDLSHPAGCGSSCGTNGGPSKGETLIQLQVRKPKPPTGGGLPLRAV
jgi:radical SAM protein with 4Fe4S-binding SPASM domain